MSVLEILHDQAAADLRYCLWWAERTGDADWQRLAANARKQRDDFAIALGRESVDA